MDPSENPVNVTTPDTHLLDPGVAVQFENSFYICEAVWSGLPMIGIHSVPSGLTQYEMIFPS